MIPIGDARRRFGFPWMTLTLVLLGVLVFLYERRMPLSGALGLVPRDVNLGYPLQTLQWALACLLAQGSGWLEPIASLVYLWAVGSKVEDACGPWGLLLIGLLSGIGGVAAVLLLEPLGSQPVYGFAGIVAGLMGAYLILYRMAPLRSWIFPLILVPVPAFLHLLYWAGLTFVNVDFGALRAANFRAAITLEANWPFLLAILVGVAAGNLFARREYLFYQGRQARAAGRG